jgi:GTP-binding protein
VSNTPGRTREVNFFRINNEFVLADLPGYGYARISKEAKQAWQPLIEGYLRTSPHLRGVVQLIDVRHPPTPDDHEMLGFLAEVGVPTLVAATKIDKLTRTQLATHLAQLSEAIGMDEDQIIPFSSVTGAGRDELAAAIVSLVTDDAMNDRPQSD